MKKLVVLLMVSLMATSAFAVIDPDPTMMGLYFDMDANTNGYDATTNVPFFAYLMLTNSEYPEISGFECNYTVDAGAMGGLFFRLAEDLQGGLNVGTTSALEGNYVVGWPAPRAAGTTLVLVSWQVMLLGEFPVSIYLAPATIPSLDTGTPVLEIGGALAPAGYSTGGTEIPVATINDVAPVAEEIESFGGVKALFR
jgi:hypothetical protein